MHAKLQVAEASTLKEHSCQPVVPRDLLCQLHQVICRIIFSVQYLVELRDHDDKFDQEIG